MIKLLSKTFELQDEFLRLSTKFDKLEIISAWLGNPAKEIPYSYLSLFNRVDVFAGISFCQTHPNGIKYILNSKNYHLQLIDEPFTFHMKVYHFYNESESALIMGSSNFTLSGFTDNAESNIVLEGNKNQVSIKDYLNEIKKQIAAFNKVTISEDWLKEYTKKFNDRKRKLEEIRINDDVVREDLIQNSVVWLRNGNWNTYMDEFKKAIEERGEDLSYFVKYHTALLDLYKYTLTVHWTAELFENEEKRAMLFGTKNKIRDYGWLGHVGASGKYMELIKSGSKEKKKMICDSMNAINKLSPKLNMDKLFTLLNQLEATGPSIKVWGRVLAITQPNLFCTISSDAVRHSLSVLLSEPKVRFTQAEGYVYLIKVIQQSPWYNSPEPKDKIEKLIWQNRCAFLDVIFRN